MDLLYHPRSARQSPIGRERTPTPEFRQMERRISNDLLYDDASMISSPPLLRRVLQTCRTCQQQMQTAVDMLLGSDDINLSHDSTTCTLNRSLGRCRDLVLTCTRQLTSGLRSLTTLLLGGLARSKEACICLEEVSDTVARLADVCTQTAHVQALHFADSKRPGYPVVSDRYAMSLAIAEIERRVNVLRRTSPDGLTSAVLLDIHTKTTESLRILEKTCASAVNRVQDPQVRDQLRLCNKSVSACGDAFSASLKPLHSNPSHDNVTVSQVLGDALVTSGNGLLTFAGTQRPLSGNMATSMGKSGRRQSLAVLTSAVSMVTPCILMCDVIRNLAHDPSDQVAKAKAHSCLTVVAKGSVKLAAALGVTVVDITSSTR